MNQTLTEIAQQLKGTNKKLKLLHEHLKNQYGFWQEEKQNG